MRDLVDRQIRTERACRLQSWTDAAALLKIGTIANAAWTSLRDRVRYGADAPTLVAN